MYLRLYIIRPGLITLFLFNLSLLLNAGQIKNDSIKKILERIDTRMSSIRSVQCDFIQEKKLSILNKPIIMSGKIFIKKPGNFAWHSVKPIKYSFIISGNNFKQWDEDSNKVVTINLNDKPALKVIVNQMNVWFSGNYIKQLNKYSITILNKKPLMLKFIPKLKEQSSEFIKSISVSFSDNLKYISSIHIMEKNNDSLKIIFDNTVLNSAIPEGVWNVFNGH